MCIHISIQLSPTNTAPIEVLFGRITRMYEDFERKIHREPRLRSKNSLSLIHSSSNFHTFDLILTKRGRCSGMM